MKTICSFIALFWLIIALGFGYKLSQMLPMTIPAKITIFIVTTLAIYFLPLGLIDDE